MGKPPQKKKGQIQLSYKIKSKKIVLSRISLGLDLISGDSFKMVPLRISLGLDRITGDS